MVKIFLDAGHGGKDGGAVANELIEKNLTLEIAKGIAGRLQARYEKVEIMLSRADDRFLSLSERTIQANTWGADILLSIHINSAANAAADGFESFVYTNVNTKTQALQNVLHEEIIKQIGGKDRGKKRANFHMVRESKMSAVLTECLFISNKSDSDKLKQPDFKNKLIEGHVIGLEKFLGLKRKQTTEPNRDYDTVKTYKVQIGAFNDRENAEALAAKAKKDGYNVYIDEQ